MPPLMKRQSLREKKKKTKLMEERLVALTSTTSDDDHPLVGIHRTVLQENDVPLATLFAAGSDDNGDVPLGHFLEDEMI